MYVYPSVDELMYMKLSKSGSVVLMPSMLLSLMASKLSPLSLDSVDDIKLVDAPFYVLKVPALPTITKVDRTEQDFRIGAKAEIATPTANAVGSVSATYRHKQVAEHVRSVNPFSPETSLATEYIDEVAESIDFWYTVHGNELKGKAIFLYYGKRIDDKIIEILSDEEIVNGSPTYIAVSVKLGTNRIDKRLIEVLRSFAESGDVSILLGIDPLPVRIKVGKTEHEISLARYLVMRMLEYVVKSDPRDRLEDKYSRYSSLTDYVMRLLFEEAKEKGETQQEAEEKYSVSTVFLNALYERLIHEYRPRRHKYRHDTIYETLRDIYESAKATALKQRQRLVKFAKLLGATDDTVRVIKSTGWVFQPYGFAPSWAMETKKHRESEEAEEVLSV